jgi:hypothetical protein
MAPAQPGGWVPPAGAVPWTGKRPSRLDDVVGASEGAVELPLFPLSTILHPGLPISLHVFEDRYWEMFGRALDSERRFGWSPSSTATRSAGPPSTTRSAAWPRSTTCGATPTGRLDVMARDERRFRVEGVTQAAQYIANVATLGESAGERGRGADRPGRPPLQPAMSPPRGRSSERARSGRSTCPMTVAASTWSRPASRSTCPTSRTCWLSRPRPSACAPRALLRWELSLLEQLGIAGPARPTVSFSLSERGCSN